LADGDNLSFWYDGKDLKSAKSGRVCLERLCN